MRVNATIFFKTVTICAVSVLSMSIGAWIMARHIRSTMTERYVNVMEYGAKGDNSTDDSKAFVTALKKARDLHLPVYIPPKQYVVDQTLDIQSGMMLVSDGGVIRHTRSDATLLRSVNGDSWTIQGPLTLVGTRTSPGQMDGEIGLKIEGGKMYSVEKLRLQSFRGSGIDISVGDDRGRRGDRGKYAFISFMDNHVGLNIHDGNGSEYNLFALLSFSGNDVATSIAAGSNVVTASNIVGNDNGVFLPDGVNDGHGIFNAVNINHNTGYNIMAAEMSQGYSFNACHIYGDSPSKGVIHLNNSHGIAFTAGTIDADVINDGWGLNYAADNFISGSLFSVGGDNPRAFGKVNNFDSGDILDGPRTNAACAPRLEMGDSR